MTQCFSGLHPALSPVLLNLLEHSWDPESLMQYLVLWVIRFSEWTKHHQSEAPWPPPPELTEFQPSLTRSIHMPHPSFLGALHDHHCQPVSVVSDCDWWRPQHLFTMRYSHPPQLTLKEEKQGSGYRIRRRGLSLPQSCHCHTFHKFKGWVGRIEVNNKELVYHGTAKMYCR